MRSMKTRVKTLERTTLQAIVRQQKAWLDSLTGEEFTTLLATTPSEVDRDLFALIRQAPLDVVIAAAAHTVGHPEREKC